jgi:RNase H-fold protein (predicted Holliday junction resolvase)
VRRDKESSPHILSVLAIDPGSAKCGIAVVLKDEGVAVRTIVSPSDIPDTVKLLAARFTPDVIVIGGGTGSDMAISALSVISIPIYVVDERLSTQNARERYFKDNPPRGWRRFVPRGMLVPSQPYDDYAAVLLAEAFLYEKK